MSASSSSLLGNFFYSRRLLLHPLPIYHSQPSSTALPPSISSQNTNSDAYQADNTFDANVVMVLAVLLCALICSLGLNSIIRCVLKFSDIISSNGGRGRDRGRGRGRDTNGVSSSNIGIKKKALKTFPTVGYSTELNLSGLDTECAICLSEFVTGERVRLLPKCNHGFHVKCIDKWLSSHSSCPKCRQCLIQTCQKIVGCSQSQATGGFMLGQESVAVSIVPLEPEALVRVYRES